MTGNEKSTREDPPAPRAERLRLQPDLFPSIEVCCEECCHFLDMAARQDDPEDSPDDSKARDRVRRR
ncbi:hypothetical protein [Amaricoccus sp.]|uniref:hypothetical protein n=1 Tax=Amaricoccus sp. TaxID=1872485 RepID=UPI001B789314|nr:hypothetical protein [Amaricoccus sp.]MBP7241496.1 hypothetical protein [Amaricoccus sp.]